MSDEEEQLLASPPQVAVLSGPCRVFPYEGTFRLVNAPKGPEVEVLRDGVWQSTALVLPEEVVMGARREEFECDDRECCPDR